MKMPQRCANSLGLGQPIEEVDMAERTCSVEGCDRKGHYSNGWCPMHYQRWRRTGSMADPVRPSPEDLFWAKVNKNGPVPQNRPELGPCWLWTGSRDNHGYGQLQVRSIAPYPIKAYRFAWEMTRGPILSGVEAGDRYELDHLCRVRACVNPGHLELVTHRVNMVRGFGPHGINARKTHCIHGHEFTPENTYIRPSTGHRYCRTCARNYRS